MHFCFVYAGFGVGGIETLMLRKSKWLIAHGHSVTILGKGDGPMKHAFPKEVLVVASVRLFDALAQGSGRVAEEFLANVLCGRPVDVFYSFYSTAVPVAATLLYAHPRPARFLVGVYGPEDYVMNGRFAKSPIMASIAYPAPFLFHYRLPESCRVYMNSAMHRYVETRSPNPVPGSVCPLPVDGAPFRTLVRRPERGLIVSVGRLDPMKEYNFWMIEIIEALVREGFDVRWEIYGDGIYRDEMLSRIQAKGLNDRIALKGTIPYERLADAFVNAFMFLGMGTTLIEAGFAGVPAISARAFDTLGLSYGFLHELPEYSCGELVEQPLKSVKDLITRVLLTTEDQYARLAAEERKHADRFDIEVVMLRFMTLIEGAPLLDQIWRPSWRSYATKVYSVASKMYRCYGRSRTRVKVCTLR